MISYHWQHTRFSKTLVLWLVVVLYLQLQVLRVEVEAAEGLVLDDIGELPHVDHVHHQGDHLQN